MHQQGARAYQQTAKVVESPRDREAALLVKAAFGIQRARDDAPGDEEELKAALTFNRKLWTIFMSSVVKDDNPLPEALRQNIANLGMFILNETREILLGQAPASRVDVLININRQLAAGLRAK